MSTPVLTARHRPAPSAVWVFRDPETFAVWARKRSNRSKLIYVHFTDGFRWTEECFGPTPAADGSVHENTVAWGYSCFIEARKAAEDRECQALLDAAPRLLAGLKWALAQMQGDSGTGETYWEQFPEYAAACAVVETVEASK